jgi:hypothetical protein
MSNQDVNYLEVNFQTEYEVKIEEWIKGLLSNLRVMRSNLQRATFDSETRKAVIVGTAVQISARFI